jgi:transposase
MDKRNTIGMDMGDKNHRICVIGADAEVVAKEDIGNRVGAIREYFGKYEPCVIAMEAGTHSAWVSRELEAMGHEVLVGNPRKLRAIWDTDEKDDDRDAEMLARIARFDRSLLHPIHHRGKEAHTDLAVLKARDVLVRSRSKLVAHVRGSVKASGSRIRSCSAESFHYKAIGEIPEELRKALAAMIEVIEDLTARIREYDKQIEALCDKKYPETDMIRQIAGVGPITALGYVLTIEESSRFQKSRTAGAFLGLTTKRDKSGETDKQLHITKAGNVYLRRLLVGSAQYIMGPFGPDCDLRRFGMKLAQRGGKNAKRRAVVAVARKLAVLIHHLWASGETYDPFYRKNRKHKKAA